MVCFLMLKVESSLVPRLIHRQRNPGVVPGHWGHVPPKFSVCSIYVLYYKVIYYILCPPNQKVFLHL